MLIIHIATSLLSLSASIGAGLILLRQNRISLEVLRAISGLTAGSLTSGIFLVLQGSSLLRVCLEGFVLVACNFLVVKYGARTRQPATVTQ
jgi:hypothetical protein